MRARTNIQHVITNVQGGKPNVLGARLGQATRMASSKNHTGGGDGLRIAVEGCCHGELDSIYATLLQAEKETGQKIDLLLCCGDFQAVRNANDLEQLSCPIKYREMKDFYKYYSGEKVAPIMTVFIGGNHEGSNHLWELFHGGWVAPNIFFMGFAGVINYGGVRIGGLSGIYKGNHYRWGHHETIPYNSDTIRSIYHVRQFEAFQLSQIKQPIDIMMSHDWPRGIAFHGNKEALFRKKPFLKDEILENSLGSPPAEHLLHTLRPDYWFSAHHHVKFSALVTHPSDGRPAAQTRFLSLDKCLPNRDFLQILDLPGREGERVITFDEEWLAIVKSTHHALNLERAPKPLPPRGGRQDFSATEEELAYVRARLAAQPTGANVPEFTRTAPVHTNARLPPLQARGSPQTAAFLNILELPDRIGATLPWDSPDGDTQEAENPEAIDLDSSSDEEGGQTTATTTPPAAPGGGGGGGGGGGAAAAPSEGFQEIPLKKPAAVGGALKMPPPTGGLNLPPPRSALGLPPPTQTHSTSPPVRGALNLPAPSATADLPLPDMPREEEEGQPYPKRARVRLSRDEDESAVDAEEQPKSSLPAPEW